MDRLGLASSMCLTGILYIWYTGAGVRTEHTGGKTMKKHLDELQYEMRIKNVFESLDNKSPLKMTGSPPIVFVFLYQNGIIKIGKSISGKIAKNQFIDIFDEVKIFSFRNEDEMRAFYEKVVYYKKQRDTFLQKDSTFERIKK